MGQIRSPCDMTTPKAVFVPSILLISLSFLSACASFRAGSVRIGDTPACRMAKDPSIPGKNVTGQCLPFAVALNQKLQAAGIASKVIGYSYELPLTSPMAERTGGKGAHAVVVYNDDGRTYVMDNQSWAPRWVSQTSP